MFPGKEDLFLCKWEGDTVPKLLKVARYENDLPAGEDSDGVSVIAAFHLEDILPLCVLIHYHRYLIPLNGSIGTVIKSTCVFPVETIPRMGLNSPSTPLWAHLFLLALGVLMHHLLPSTKCSVRSALSYILNMKPTGTSIPSLLGESPEAAVHQPKLVCLGHPSTRAQYIIVSKNDKVAILLLDEGLTCTIDKLFKVFWVCSVAYPAQLESVYGFFEYVYDMPISCGKRSKVVELIAKLKAVL